ncbi:MAG: hypothetical protein JRN08_09550, partial [Nitrososphaerota archaeon]|nr:hypothetical protein [Nitrososphaerota archaeon]
MEAGRLLRDAFGLNSYEAKLYVALIGRPMRAAGAAQASGVPLSRTYDTLRSLQRKGFVTESGGEYRSIAPAIALDSRLARYGAEFESEQAGRRAAMKRITVELGPLARPSASEAEPVMLKGLDSISAAFLDVLRSSKEVYLVVRKGLKARAAFVGVLREAGGNAE